MAISYPNINGQRISFASLEAQLPGMPSFTLFKALNYTDKMDPGKVRGNSPIMQGKTMGDYEATGSIELFKEEDSMLIQNLGPGFLTVSFNLVVTYTPIGGQTIIDTIKGMNFTSGDGSNTQGTDGLVVKREFLAFKILWNGVDPVPAAANGNQF